MLHVNPFFKGLWDSCSNEIKIRILKAYLSISLQLCKSKVSWKCLPYSILVCAYSNHKTDHWAQGELQDWKVKMFQKKTTYYTKKIALAMNIQPPGFQLASTVTFIVSDIWLAKQQIFTLAFFWYLFSVLVAMHCSTVSFGLYQLLSLLSDYMRAPKAQITTLQISCHWTARPEDCSTDIHLSMNKATYSTRRMEL